MKPKAERKGFTLIELLIVVAIIAILAAIAVPNFLEAQTRSKVSRMQTDLRTLSLGVDSYTVDHNRFPRQPPRNACVVFCEVLRELTTPIAYLTSFPLDIFHRVDGAPEPISYGVCTSGSPYYYLWSYAPDQDNDYAMLLYDPTNGTISDGDLKRTVASDILTVSPQP
jgi:prepilin-type N-terminal cleavage/methylation domain-containing protein